VSVNSAGVLGQVAPGFERVRRILTNHAPDVLPGGAGFAAVVDGELVVDLWVGRAGAVPWSMSTRAVLMSATKGVASAIVARLIELGDIDPDAHVAEYWPEFAQGGKQAITVAEVLSHRSGIVTVPGYKEFMDADGRGWESTSEIVRRIESAEPAWEPGSAHGYHGLTFGWLVGELVRRATGSTIGRLVHDELAARFALELELGTGDENLPLVAPVTKTQTRLVGPEELNELNKGDSLYAQMLLAIDGRSVLDTADVIFNRRELLSVELAGSNATGTARALAQMYGVLAGDVARGPTWLSPDVIEMVRRERVRGPSQLTGVEERWGLGFQLALDPGPRSGNPWGPHEEAFGHLGLGGQIGFADPVSRVGVGLVRSHLSPNYHLGANLIDAFYQCL